jgi:EAL domain-containing protein (putative c-di-GMP-specific phosphodiesterase class I)
MFARFVPDEVKLDMGLVRNIDSDTRRRAIVRGVVQMCRELETLVITEGVETSAEAETLRELGVHYHQGFWCAHPAVGKLPKVA